MRKEPERHQFVPLKPMRFLAAGVLGAAFIGTLFTAPSPLRQPSSRPLAPVTLPLDFHRVLGYLSWQVSIYLQQEGRRQ